MFDERICVGMMQLLSLKSPTYKTTENLWASNMEGPRSFETWQVRIWSKCHSVSKKQSTVEPLSAKSQYSSNTQGPREQLFNLHGRPQETSRALHFVFHFFFFRLCFPDESYNLCPHADSFQPLRSRQRRQTSENKSLVLQQGLNASPVTKNNCVWWSWRQRCWAGWKGTHLWACCPSWLHLCGSIRYKRVVTA